MKTLITGFGLCMMILIASRIQLNITNQGTREFELSNAVNNAVIETQRTYLNSNKITTDTQYMTCFNNALKQYITSDSDLEVSFYSADVTTGLLDVEVKEIYHSENKEKTIACRRTNMIDEYETVEKINVLEDSYLVTYDIDSSIQLNLTGMNKGIEDKNANIIYHLKKGETGLVKILIVSGTVNSVQSNNQSLDFNIENGYLVFELPVLTENTTITIK